MDTRIFLVAPDQITDTLLQDCAAAACSAADCATILVSQNTSAKSVEALQALNLAVIFKDCEPQKVLDAKADGLLLSNIEDFKDARDALKKENLGFLAGVSRHAAMEAAELGADFICFTQTKQYAGEPIIAWWQDVTHIPSVAFDAVTDAAVKAQLPDFVRPSDAMWENTDSATTTLNALKAHWST